MDQAFYDQEFIDSIRPDISHIEIEDGAPVDRIRSEKQMRFLAESMNTSWEDNTTPNFFSVEVKRVCTRSNALR